MLSWCWAEGQGAGGKRGLRELVDAIVKEMQTSGTACLCVDSRVLMQAGRHIWSVASSRLQQEWASSASSHPTPAGYCHLSPGTQPLLGGGIAPFVSKVTFTCLNYAW